MRRGSKCRSDPSDMSDKSDKSEKTSVEDALAADTPIQACHAAAGYSAERARRKPRKVRR